jgi:hypothetical protein
LKVLVHIHWKSAQRFLWSLKGLIQEGEGTNVGSKFKPPAPPQGRHPATNEIHLVLRRPLFGLHSLVH